MSTESTMEERIEAAADAIGSVWPLHSFVTANPLAGFEDRPFHQAVAEAERLLGGDGYPSSEVFRRAWEAGRIDEDVVSSELAQRGYDVDPESSLDRMAADESAAPATRETTTADGVDAVLSKWLSSFLDQGQAEWPMPNREQGFYEAVRTVAPHDGDVPDGETLAALPDRPVDAVAQLLADHSPREQRDVLESQLAALPGWTGYLKQRAADGGAWQSAYPITLAGYLAVRLALVDLFDAPLAPGDAPSRAGDRAETAGSDVPLSEVWLTAWEATYRAELVDSITEVGASAVESDDDGRPDAQLVFCIDTRSEIIRRHIEATGDYETHGYAGFFGLPIRYEGHGADVAVDACPPILDPRHRVAERPTGESERRDEHDTWRRASEVAERALESLKSNAATAFNFVESTGAAYGVTLAARTLLPERVHDVLDAADERVPDSHEFCDLSVDAAHDDGHGLPEGFTLEEKVEYAATAFELMGWEEFARLVVFAGHASQTTNNPFDASLDCGACAGNPGGPNARVLATICNDEAVRDGLRDRGIDVPEETVFLAAEHNTTTDEIALYADSVPETHESDLERLRDDLAEARAGAAAERADDMGAGEGSGVPETERRAADWAETRPEWGLAGNAGFVVGPRDLTADLDLDGRSFLHSYDWRTDPSGDALEAILTGPMVVTQWINSQYYFATIDNPTYGSGSKVTQNPVGNVGVYQGNGGDLMTGLPFESLMGVDGQLYHQPLRLSTVVHAPVDSVTDVLADHDEVTELLDNGWLSLTVVDPEQDHRAFHYDGELGWTPTSERTAAAPNPRPAAPAADD